MSIDRDAVLARLFQRQYGSPVVRNDLRGELVEEIVGFALQPEWILCGGDWASHDLEHHKTGLKIQVKQSAALQSWATTAIRSAAPRFSIASKMGRWEGPSWVPGAGRNADIFIFAWHPFLGGDCDHARPEQWNFFVVRETELPAQKSIGLSQIVQLSASVGIESLRAKVAWVAGTIGQS